MSVLGEEGGRAMSEEIERLDDQARRRDTHDADGWAGVFGDSSHPIIGGMMMQLGLMPPT